jgi:hypothetical protein
MLATSRLLEKTFVTSLLACQTSQRGREQKEASGYHDNDFSAK